MDEARIGQYFVLPRTQIHRFTFGSWHAQDETQSGDSVLIRWLVLGFKSE